MQTPRRDLGLIVALSWLFVAAGLTVAIGPELGLRGLVFLGIHHLLCIIGTTHELWRAWKRRQTPPAERSSS